MYIFDKNKIETGYTHKDGTKITIKVYNGWTVYIKLIKNERESYITRIDGSKVKNELSKNVFRLWIIYIMVIETMDWICCT